MPRKKKRAGGRTGKKKTKRRRARRPDARDRALREHLLKQLSTEAAHVGFDDIVADWPAELRGVKPPGAPHSAWELLEHLRLAQWDILDFWRNPDYEERDFPAGYWPQTEAPPSAAAWEESVRAFRKDLGGIKRLVRDPKTDLYARIPHGQGQTYLREALLVASHTSYHLGQLVLLRRLLGAWPQD